jgi:transposase-like protein
MRRFIQCRLRLVEVFMKINGKPCYVWRAFDEGEATAQGANRVA